MNTFFTYLRKKRQVEVRVRNKIGVGVKKVVVVGTNQEW